MMAKKEKSNKEKKIKDVIKELEEGGLPKQTSKRIIKELEKEQLPLFISTPQEHPVLRELRKVDLKSLTPVEAHHKLCELCRLTRVN